MQCRYEILICNLVDNIACQHRVCGKEDEITVRNELGRFIVGHIAYYILNGYRVVGPAGDPPRYANFVACESPSEFADD